MRPLNRIILHCSATEEGDPYNVADVTKWHQARGWKTVGYHYVIQLDGTTDLGRPIEQVGAHVKGHNADSIGVCYIGGLKEGKPADTMTERQEIAFTELVFSLRRVFGYMPVSGHNEYSNKACPSFNVQTKYRYLNE